MKAGMKELAARAWGAWNKFWFESDAEAQLRVFRFIVGVLLFLFYLPRTLDLELFYSETGVLPLEAMSVILPSDQRWTLLSGVSSLGALYALHTLFLVSLLLLGMGVWPRVMTWVAWVLHVSFLNRNLTVVFGADFIAGFQLLYLGVAYLGWGEGRKLTSSVAFRLIQIQLCIVYAFAGMHKLKGPKWWMGEAIWDVWANPQYARWDLSWVSQFPLVVIFLTYLTIGWELYFPVLVWVRKARPWALGLGVVLHGGMALTMGLPFFAAVMLANYVLFLSPECLSAVEVSLRARGIWPNFAALGSVALPSKFWAKNPKKIY